MNIIYFIRGECFLLIGGAFFVFPPHLQLNIHLILMSERNVQDKEGEREKRRTSKVIVVVTTEKENKESSLV